MGYKSGEFSIIDCIQAEAEGPWRGSVGGKLNSKNHPNFGIVDGDHEAPRWEQH